MANAVIPAPFPQLIRPGGIQTIRGISSSDWFSPLEPIPSSAPSDLQPRRWEYTPGQNIIFTPRGEEAIGFGVLRALADAYDLLRSVIETWKSLVITQKWSIQAKLQPGETDGQRRKRESNDSAITALTDFFEFPDGEHEWSVWLNALLEDMGVLDAANVWVEREASTRKVLAFRPLDGGTITRYINAQGFTPTPPNQAYAQVLYGQPAVPLTSNDLLYLMRNWRTHKLYGYGPVEQAIVTINIALRRQMFTLSYYTEGNVPEAFYTMPPNVTTDQVREFQDWFDSILTGNLARKRRVIFMPGDEKGSQKLTMTKEPLLKNELDDWLASFFCFLFGVSRQSLIKQMNRASAEQSADSASEEGLKPTLLWVTSAVNRMIRAMGYKGYEIIFETTRDVDPVKQAQADELVTGRIVHINETRKARGLDPDPNPFANMLGSFTPTGFVPLGDSSVKSDDPDKPPTRATGKKDEVKAPPLPKVAKKFPPLDFSAIHIQAHDTPETQMAQHHLERSIADFLSTQAKAAGARVSNLLQARKVRKDEKSEADLQQAIVDAALDFNWYSLVYSTETSLFQSGASGAVEGVNQVQITDTAALVEAQKLAQAYSQDRAAEMVGMKWIDGELVPNSAAKWDISETTRDLIRAEIAEAFSKDTPLDALEAQIEESGAFSPARAKMIAKTEITRSQARGILYAWKATGVVLTSKWVTSSIHGCCDICDVNAAAGPIEVGKAFPSGDTEPGAHPNCNCALVAVEIKGA